MFGILENRQLMSATPIIQIAPRTLVITGTPAGDTIVINEVGNTTSSTAAPRTTTSTARRATTRS